MKVLLIRYLDHQKKNDFVVNEIINVKKMGFMKSKALVSKFNKKTYLGKCNTCLEMCGLNLK